MKNKVEGYCVKCRTKKEIKDPKQVTLKNSKKAITGTCHSCGTKMFRIGNGPDISPLDF